MFSKYIRVSGVYDPQSCRFFVFTKSILTPYHEAKKYTIMSRHVFERVKGQLQITPSSAKKSGDLHRELCEDKHTAAILNTFTYFI
jgi:hypothetical protein